MSSIQDGSETETSTDNLDTDPHHSPVFIVGMNGSGTTMLADSLGKHPALYIFPHESKVLPYFLSRVSGYGDLDQSGNRRRLSDAIGATKPYWQVNDRKPLVLSDDELTSCRSFGDVVSSIYQSLARRHGKTRWGDKSPANTHHIESLSRAFPSAKFIHIIRDGRDAARSFHRRWGYHPIHTIWRWKHAVSHGRAQGLRLPNNRYMEVRYEGITSSPDREMRRICAFLGLEFHEAILSSSMRYVDSSNKQATTGRLIENSGKWKSYFSPKTIGAMEGISGQLLNELGYSVDIKGHSDIRAIKRNYLKFRDGAAFTVYFFRERGLRSIPLFIKVVGAALKQWSVTKHPN